MGLYIDDVDRMDKLFSAKFKTPWKTWWAWKPVTTVGGQRVWFAWCFRRHWITIEYGWDGIGIETKHREYGTIFDVKAHPDMFDDSPIKLTTRWKKWWAWKPVKTLGGQRVWLTWCYRRYDGFYFLGKGPSCTTHYGTIFDVITHPDK